MGNDRALANRGDSTRAALLDGAQRCLQRDGYSRTTARNVAIASGANLRSIGYHYGSLGELLTAALSRNFRAWLAPLVDGSPVDADDARRQLASGLHGFSMRLADNRTMARAWLEAVATAQDDPALRDRLAANQEWFRKALAGKLEAAGIAEAGVAAAAIVTVCDGLLVRRLLHDESPTPGAVAAAAEAALSGL